MELMLLLDALFFVDSSPILPDHTHFLPTESGVLDHLIANAEERVFVLLVVGRKGVLVEQHQFRVICAGFREFGKLRWDGRDQAGLSPHALVVGHRHVLPQRVEGAAKVSRI